ncbi:MAG: hypothetical protein M1823_005388 [Watsoniomyces obsoletus]|nr:MAG: hypothetical protein M1823_005388 [Watsoniomyces obsoletus]
MLGLDRGQSSSSSSSWSQRPPSSTASPRPIPSPSPPPLPRGECRFILLLPDVNGQRCACQGFRRHDTVPGSSCECGHQACYHVPETSREGIERQELEALRTRVLTLEGECDVRRVEEVRDRVERVEVMMGEGQARLDEDIRAVCRAVQGIHASVTRLQLMAAGRFLAHEDKIEGLLDRWTAIEGELERVRRRLTAIDDVTMRLEDRMGGGGERSRSRSNSEMIAALGDIPLVWTARVVMIPNQPWLGGEEVAWTVESTAYRRCLSRGLVREVVFGDVSAVSIKGAIEEIFTSALNGRNWMPLARGSASSTNSFTLEHLPLDDMHEHNQWDRDFLSQYCLIELRTTQTLYMTLSEDDLTWGEIRQLHMEDESKEDSSSWEHDEALDGPTTNGPTTTTTTTPTNHHPHQTIDDDDPPHTSPPSRVLRKRRSRSISTTAAQLPPLKKKRSFSGTLHFPSLPASSSSSGSSSASPTKEASLSSSSSSSSTIRPTRVRIHRSTRQIYHYGLCPSSSTTGTAAAVV